LIVALREPIGRSLRRGEIAARCLAGLAAGLAAATALPPLSFLPGLLGFSGLLLLLRRAETLRGAFLLGWCFGLGWYGAGLYWVAIAFYADAERFGALAIPAVAGLTAACALFAGLAAALAAARRWHSVMAQALLFALVWTLGEELRGWVAQFPWNPVAVVWVGSPAAQVLAWIGTPALSFLTVAAAGLPATFLARADRGRYAGPAVALCLLALGFGAGQARLALLPLPASTELELRLVQAAVPQDTKWAPRLREAWFRRHLELSAAPRPTPPDLVIWPESAVPYPIEGEPLVREMLGQAVGPHSYLVTGGDRYDLEVTPPYANNSLFALDSDGRILARYDKVDLVPFGEFLPFRELLSAIGLRRLAEGTFDFAPGPGRRTLRLPGIPPFSPLICYEAIFSGRAVADHGPRPDWLLNITNDGWFGQSSGPYQHLAMARMRAIEEGLPLVRAANTGISVVTDAFGRETARLDLGERGVLDADLPGALPPTLFARYGDFFFLLSMALGVVLVLVLEAGAAHKVARLAEQPSVRGTANGKD
jgi:apolipoprotein N-acyltransferase